MLRMLAELEDIAGGSVSMVFQSYALYPHMSVCENIAFGPRRQKVLRAKIERRVNHVSGLLGLEQLLDRKPKNLSGGQQRRKQTN